MPRPRKNPDELLKKEIRITPPSGSEITNWRIDERFSKFVAFKEGGGDTGKNLHYHCYIETTMTSQALPKWIYTVCECIESGERGNAVFFTRTAHDHTMGYISKQKECVVRHNYDQTHIEEWFKQSDAYNKQKESVRKREQRERQAELQVVYDATAKDLHADENLRTVNNVIRCLLTHCHHTDIRFPAKTQMDSFVCKLLYPYDCNTVVDYYARSFPRI